MGRTGACPEVEALAAAEQTPEVRQHLETCARCRTELALLQEFEAVDVQPGEGESVAWIEDRLRSRAGELSAAPPTPAATRSWWRFPQWRVLALASAAALLISVGIYQRTGTQPDLPSPGPTPVWRSGQLALLAPLGDIAAPPREFRWEAVPGASSYRVHVLQVDGTEIWSGESAESRIAVPVELLHTFIPARAFQWRVEARNPAGEQIATASLQTFHILTTAR